MEKPLPDSIFVFEAKKLCCVSRTENLKKILLKHTGIAEVDADVEKNTITIKGTINIVKLITIFRQDNVDADLVYYKNERWEGWGDDDQPTEAEACDDEENHCFRDSDQDVVDDTGESDHVFKDEDQRKESRGKKEKGCCCDEFDDNEDEEEEDIGADHYRIRNTFKDHKPEKYVPPKEEYYWGDVGSGMHRRFPVMPGAASHFTAAFPDYHRFYYPAPWPQEHYM